MSRDQIIADAMSAFQSAQAGVVGDVYDKSFLEGAASVPPADADEQVKIDAAVKAQADADQLVIDGLNQQISDLSAKDALDMQAAVDAKAAGDAAVADLQAKFDALSAKEGVEASIVDGLKGSLASLQDVVAKLASIQSPAPVEPSV